MSKTEKSKKISEKMEECKKRLREKGKPYLAKVREIHNFAGNMNKTGKLIGVSHSSVRKFLDGIAPNYAPVMKKIDAAYKKLKAGKLNKEPASKPEPIKPDSFREVIQTIVDHHGGKLQAARVLGVSDSAIYYYLKEENVPTRPEIVKAINAEYARIKNNGKPVSGDPVKSAVKDAISIHIRTKAEKEEELLNMLQVIYEHCGKNQRVTGDMIGVASSAVSTWLIGKNVPRNRKSVEGVKKAYKQIQMGIVEKVDPRTSTDFSRNRYTAFTKIQSKDIGAVIAGQKITSALINGNQLVLLLGNGQKVSVSIGQTAMVTNDEEINKRIRALEQEKENLMAMLP